MFFFEKEIMALLQSHFSKENLEIEKNYLHHINSIQADTLWFIRVELSWSLEKKMISRSNSKSHFENLSHFLKFYTHSDAKEGIILMWGLGDFQRGGRREENRMFLCRNTYPSLCHLNGGGIEVYTGSNGEALKTHGSLQ